MRRPVFEVCLHQQLPLVVRTASRQVPVGLPPEHRRHLACSPIGHTASRGPKDDKDEKWVDAVADV